MFMTLEFLTPGSNAHFCFLPIFKKWRQNAKNVQRVVQTNPFAETMVVAPGKWNHYREECCLGWVWNVHLWEDTESWWTRGINKRCPRQHVSVSQHLSITAFGPESRRTVTTRDGLLGPPSPSGSPQSYRQRLSIVDIHKMPGRLGRCPYNTSKRSLLLKFS